jgi:TatD DNase family protein
MEKLQIKACSVSIDNANSKKTLELAKRSPLILPFIGIHPEKLHVDLGAMAELISKNHDQISGIGEIGLDKTYTRSEEDFRKQKEIFAKLLSLAEKYDKPVSIHSRKTLEEIYKILPSYSLKKCLLHWFDGNKKQLEKAMDMGLFVSYGPAMVYATDKQNLLLNTIIEKVLVETDGPVRFSHCFGFKPAEISFIPSVIFSASKILRKSYNELTTILEQNSKKFLGI